jgi:hypothetical protein
MKKAQVAAEAAMLITFMTLAFILFFLVISDRYVGLSEQRKDELVVDLGDVIKAEIGLAATAEPGYHREIFLPKTLRGISYNLSFHSFRELNTNYSLVIINSTGYQNVVEVPKYVFGTFCKGKNIIRKNFNFSVILKCAEVGTVFVTSGFYVPGSDFSNIEEADTICNSLASNAGLGGAWKAWLSTSSINAKSRIPDRKYLRTNDGLTVADSISDLIDGDIQNSILYDENGNSVAAFSVWTGTDWRGENDQNCNNWNGNGIGTLGKHNQVNSRWTEDFDRSCTSFGARFYCFETS